MVAVDASTPPPMTHKRASIDTHNFELAIEHGNVLKRRHPLNEPLCVAKSLVLSFQVNVHINLEQFTKLFYQCTEIALSNSYELSFFSAATRNLCNELLNLISLRIFSNRNEHEKRIQKNMFWLGFARLEFQFTPLRCWVFPESNHQMMCVDKINLLQTKYRYKTSSWAHNLFQIILANGLWIFLCLHSREHVNRQCDRPKYLFIQIHEIRLIFFWFALLLPGIISDGLLKNSISMALFYGYCTVISVVCFRVVSEAK